ncbi:hypothetical protein BAE44_0016313 [Dichanthelium oligosanthes]|uniref:DUF676 domain-containing protein n=1 Tax=Dichanthelium oligosanthes TaxID=888268 RepID=A0A1E5VCB9_9POAL|nr:hypothetical protein BAE44_0016313 [Dichanthelium oligosanthes]
MASGGEGGDEERRRKPRRQLWATCLPRPGCFTVSAAGEDEGTSAAGAGEGGTGPTPTHLVVTVNGIVGSAENWRFAAKHFIKKHPEDVVVHCSGCNSAARTFDGVDVMGRRLAEEIPLLRGSSKLEKMVYRLSWIAGKSGKHLFLKDIEDEKPPLLLQMVTDYGGLHFMSALRSFKRRVAYSNVCSDCVSLTNKLVIVGWRTSSIRRLHELPERQSFINDGRYPHIVYVEEPKVQDVDFSDAMIYQAKTTSEMEEVMLKGLNRLPWERVDVSFKKSRQRFFAHSTIQVKTYFLNSDGADVGKGLAVAGSLIGSRPPRCEGKCAPCGRCEAVQVPVAPRVDGGRGEAAEAEPGRAHLFGPAGAGAGDSVQESYADYKPLNWKCRCADRRALDP